VVPGGARVIEAKGRLIIPGMLTDEYFVYSCSQVVVEGVSLSVCLFEL